MTAGTEGYERFHEEFIDCCRTIDFNSACAEFKEFLPAIPARILDIGSGAGQNAAALSGMGYDVTAIEPVPVFLKDSAAFYQRFSIQWVLDSLPELKVLDAAFGFYDFVLINAVWHHLDNHERNRSISRIAALVANGGYCAVSLRNGPAGIGTRVFPTSLNTTIEKFQNNGFSCVFKVQNKPSILSNKKDVTWARAVFKKIT